MAEKRRASGRACKNAKRVRTSTKPPTPKDATPVKEATPIVVDEVREKTPLPNKVVESRALPTLSEAQSLDVPNDEFRSIAESGVLLASLDRSRQKWLSGSFLEKYWTKTSGRKDAPPPPPNNPHKSWMKEIGPCTIIIEPLVLEATAFYVKEPGPPPPPVAYVPSPQPQSQTQSQPQPPQHHTPQQYQPPPPPPHQHYQPPYQHQTPQYHQPQQPRGPAPPAPMQANNTGSPYGAPYSTPSSQYQARNLPPPPPPPSAHQPSPDHRALPPIMPATARVPPPLPAAAPPPPPPANKQSPDPVIQMLASRASSDVELKALMKIVATGNANQEQLRIFQRHIDELTQMINANKAQTPAAPYAHPTPSRPHSSATPNIINLHSATPSPRPPIYPMPHAHQPPPPPQPKYQSIPSYPIVLEFQGQGASPDRFRFPANSIIEFLTPHSLLASFLLIRKGSEVGPHLEPETDYYEPVTIKMNASEGRPVSRHVLEYIRRCVKPPDQVRKWMTETIEKSTRADRRYLALRLPHKSGVVEVEEEIPVVQEVKPRPRPAPKKKKEEKDKEQDANKDAAKDQNQEGVKDATINKDQVTSNETDASQPKPQEITGQSTAQAGAAGPSTKVQEGEKQAASVEAQVTTQAPLQLPADAAMPESASKNTRKKSVRISEVNMDQDGGAEKENVTTQTTIPQQ